MSDSLHPTSDSESDHLFFRCSSGEFLWGQLHCICEGYFNRFQNHYDTPHLVPTPLEGGTVLQRSYRYRCRAMKGDWQAKLYRTRLTLTSESFDSGYIIYNVHYNPVEILRRCAAVGKSLHQDHNDRSIVYINRYDWSAYHRYKFESEINQLLGINNNHFNDDSSSAQLFSGRVMIIDSDAALNIIQQLKSHPSEILQSQKTVLFETPSESNNPVGLHLTIRNGEYEFAWLVFNSDEPSSELIAVVYDGRYTLLDGQIMLDHNDVVSWDKYQSKVQERARVEAELWKKMQADAEERDDADICAIMNNRGSKTIEELADEFITHGFRFHGSNDVVQKYSGQYSDFQLIVDAIQKKLAGCARNP